MSPIREKVERCLSVVLTGYSEVSRNHIFIHVSPISKTTMTMRPFLPTLLFPKSKWSFVLIINSRSKELKRLDIEKISDTALIGILAHELAHIVQYMQMNQFQLAVTFFKYISSRSFARVFERAADYIAIQRGFKKELLSVREQQLNDSDISPEYKKLIKDLCISPEEIETL